MEQQKSYCDWEVGKLMGMIEGLALQGVITEAVCEKNDRPAAQHRQLQRPVVFNNKKRGEE